MKKDFLSCLPISNELFLSAIFDRFYSIYIMDIPNDVIIPIKISSKAQKYLINNTIPWASTLTSLISFVADSKSKAEALSFFSKEHIYHAFQNLKDSQELVYSQNDLSWRRAVIQSLEMENGNTTKALLTIMDISQAREQYEELLHDNIEMAKKTNSLSKLFFDSAVDMYSGILKANLITGEVYQLEFDDGHIKEKLMPNSWEKEYKLLLSLAHPDDRPDIIMKTHVDTLKLAADGSKIQFTYRSRMQSSDYHWYNTVIHVASDIHGNKIISAFSIDIHQDMIEKSKLKEASELDGLTDLFNRSKLEVMLDTEYTNLSSCGVIFFDLNDLKIANDVYGHEYGDKLLIETADSIRSITSRQIHAYRYGGDEFLVIACNIKKARFDNLIVLWKTRLKALIEDSNIPCSVAYGKVWSDSNESVVDLIRSADAEMYECKKKMKAKKDE